MMFRFDSRAFLKSLVGRDVIMWLRQIFKSFSHANEAEEDIKEFKEPGVTLITPNPSIFEKKESTLENLTLPKIEVKETKISTSVEKLWKRYLDHSHSNETEESDNPDDITGDGLLLLAQDLGIEPIDPMMLVLFWKMNAKRQYLFSKEEFVDGLKALGVSSLEDIINKIPIFKNEMKDPIVFRKFYVYVFDYSKAFKSNMKIIPFEVAVPTWQILLVDRFPKLEEWCTFITNVYKKPISKDLWIQFLEYTLERGEHDDSGSWPVAIDEFVEFQKK